MSEPEFWQSVHVSIISACYTGSDIKATTQNSESSLSKPEDGKKPKVIAFRNQFLLMTWWPTIGLHHLQAPFQL